MKERLSRPIMRGLADLSAVLFLAFIAAGCAASLKTKAAIEADRLASEGAWDEAVLKYEEELKKDPDNIAYRIKYAKARAEAARAHFARGGENIEKGNHDAALLEFRASLMLDPTFKKAEDEIRRTKKLIESAHHYGRGTELLKEKKSKEAKEAFEKALRLNPENTPAREELDKIKKEAPVVIGGFTLDLKSAKPITLEFRDAEIKRIFDVLSKLSGINFLFDAEVRDVRTSIVIRDAPFKDTLELLLATNNLSKKVVSENTIIIYPTTPAKQKQYEDLLIKVFYLTNIAAKKAVNLLRTMLKIPDIYVHEELNALVVRGRPDALELAEKILTATDRTDAEVVLAVEILEVNRNKLMNLGIKAPTALSLTAPNTDLATLSSPFTFPSTAEGILLRDLDKLSSADLLMAIPAATLNLKMEDLEAEILANPRIRVKNNEKARIHIGNRVPIITTTVLAGTTQTQESVQYLDVGVKFNVEPTVKPNDEIDLKLSLEVSSIGTKSVTEQGSILYEIGTRNAETTLILNDGETQIIGGLLSDEERTTTVKIPGLGNIPVIGKLFSNTDKSGVKTDILLSITPHIVRRLEIPEEEVARIWSGREEAPSPGPGVFSPTAPFERNMFEPPPPPPPPPLPGVFPPPGLEPPVESIP